MAKPDQTLIQESRAGRLKAFDVLMQRYEKLVYRVTYPFGRSRENALDMTQNVFIKIYRNLDGFQDGSNFKAWMLRIAYNEGVDWSRRRGRRPEELVPGQDLEKAMQSPGADGSSGQFRRVSDGAAAEPDQTIRQNEQRAWILSGLRTLNEKYRLAVVLRYFQGMSIREISGVLECSEGTTKSMLFRSLRRMKSALTEKAS